MSSTLIPDSKKKHKKDLELNSFCVYLWYHNLLKILWNPTAKKTTPVP